MSNLIKFWEVDKKKKLIKNGEVDKKKKLIKFCKVDIKIKTLQKTEGLNVFQKFAFQTVSEKNKKIEVGKSSVQFQVFESFISS